MRIRWVAVALACAGCQRNDAPPAPAPAAPAAPVVSADGVTLVSAGKEPRSELRYHLAKGTQSPLEMVVDLDLEEGAARAVPSGGTAPSLVLAGTITVDDILPTGDAVVRVKLDHATVRSRGGVASVNDAFAAQAKKFEGVTQTVVLSPTGHVSSAHAGLADGSGAAAAQLAAISDQLAQVALPVPAVAVGAGASWTTTRDLAADGIAMKMTTTTTLSAVDGTRASYTASSQVTGPDQRVQLGGLELDVKHVAGSGGGGGSVDLATLAVHGTFTTSVRLEAAAGSDREQLGMMMTVALNPAH